MTKNDYVETITLQGNIKIAHEPVANALAQSGYVVIPALGEEGINDIMHSVYTKIKNTNTDKLNYNTSTDIGGDLRLHTIQKVKTLFTPVLDGYFSDYEIIMGLVFIKRASSDSDSRVGLHIDPTLLPDESKQLHLNAWIPLIDVDESNGALWVIPGSHKIFPPAHGRTIPPPFSKIQEKVMEFGACIKMKAGDALIFDNRIVHHSLQNFSNMDRPAVVLSFAPVHAKFLSLFKPAEPGSRIEVYEHSRQWYLNPEWSNDFNRPRIGNFAGYLNYTPFFATEQEFVSHLASGTLIRDYEFEMAN